MKTWRNYVMRRNDREITDKEAIELFIAEEQILRIAFYDQGDIYIVPVNYGYLYENDRYSITCNLEEEKKPAKVKPVSRAKKQKKVTEVELADDVATDEQKDKSE